MKAAFRTPEGLYEIKEIDRPVPNADQVLIKIKASGICGSNLHSWRIPLENLPWRPTLGPEAGHEFAGEVVEVGENITNLKVGDRVTVQTVIGCGKCYWCRVGQYHLCPDLGRARRAGGINTGFAEYSICPANMVYKIEDHVSYQEAALMDCIAMGVHAVHRANLKGYQTIAVIGAGAIGLSTLAIAKIMGAKTIAIVKYDFQSEVAKKVGAWETINISREDVNRVLELTDGIGVDIVFEAVGGRNPTIQLAAQLVRRGGTIAVIGSFTGPQEYHIGRLIMGERDLIGVANFGMWDNVPEFKIGLDYLSNGAINAKPMITHTFPLDQINEAFDCAKNKKETHAVKVQLVP